MSEKKVLLLYVLLFSLPVVPSRAFTSLTHLCPDSFEGTVLQVSALHAPLLNSQKISVEFRVDRVLRGSFGERVVLKFIPSAKLKVQVGSHFKASLEDGFLCTFEQL